MDKLRHKLINIHTIIQKKNIICRYIYFFNLFIKQLFKWIEKKNFFKLTFIFFYSIEKLYIYIYKKNQFK